MVWDFAEELPASLQELLALGAVEIRETDGRITPAAPPMRGTADAGGGALRTGGPRANGHRPRGSGGKLAAGLASGHEAAKMSQRSLSTKSHKFEEACLPQDSR
jgi:hypothetical protein